MKDGLKACGWSLLLGAVLLYPSEAQNRVLDSLAVRNLLDRNNLGTVSFASVARIENDRVVALNLQGRGLVQLGPEIGMLDELRTLDLRNNSLSTLPDTLTRLSKLAVLDVSVNRLTSLPAGIGRLTSLLTLGASRNSLNALPSGLTQLGLLTELYLDQNELTSLPANMRQLSFLSTLDLASNNLASVPNDLAFLLLDTLDLRDNQITALPGEFTSNTSLKTLRVENNSLCAVSASLTAWLSRVNPTWRDSQSCTSGPGIAVRFAGAGSRTGMVCREGRLSWPTGLVPLSSGSLRLSRMGVEGRKTERAELPVSRRGDRSEVVLPPAWRREPGRFLLLEAEKESFLVKSAN